jgi:hypothetical protein
MKKLINYILASSWFGLMVISVAISDFEVLVGNTPGILWLKFTGFFSYEEWRAIETSLSIVLPLFILIMIFDMIYERKNGISLYVSISSFVKRIFKRNRKAKNGSGF